MRAFKFLNGAWFGTVLLVAATPGLFTLGPYLESKFFPVVENVRIEEATSGQDGVSFYVAFDKIRQCDFTSIAWYLGAARIGVEFEPGAGNYPDSRPAGDQYAGPWLVRGVTNLDNTSAVVFHRCHPLWKTISPFYP